MKRVLVCSVAAAMLLLACRPASPPAVTIDFPTAGDTVRGGVVHVVLTATGVELAPAADEKPGTAHHHLFLDVDTGPLDQKIPAGVTGIVHLGRAQPKFHWTNVSPGTHRIIAVLADWQHVPLAGAATDTVRFVVQP